MDVSQFAFHLPKELIAQTPLPVRSRSRLMVVNRDKDRIEHTHFPQILDYLREGDVLVLNDTRVRHARLIGRKKDTGAKIELLLLKPVEDSWWEVLVKPSRRVKEDTEILFGKNGELLAIVGQETSIAGGRYIQLVNQSDKEKIEEVIEKIGEAPLPPYIQERLEDSERYQTVFSRKLGSSAAPTAGLHFTPDILKTVQNKGIKIAYVTLHVGLGTFRPVVVDNIKDHKMHSEFYDVSEETVSLIRNAKQKGKRVIGVGTTSVRTLETVAHRFDGEIKASSGWTDIFIYPGFEFKVVDALLTNFHLPRSTLLMLVSAFSSKEMILKAYQEAVREKYRFFSFGDAMFIM